MQISEKVLKFAAESSKKCIILTQNRTFECNDENKSICLQGCIEVKAEDNISGSSLSVYTKNYTPRYRMRFSMLNLQYNCGLLSSPSPLAGWLDKWMSLIAESL